LPLVGELLARLLSLRVWPKTVVAGDIVKGLDVPANSCDLVFASHVLEHLPKEDCYRALKNIYRWLRPGGYFRCIVPDLEIYARRYLERLESRDCTDTAASHSFMADANVGLQSSRNGVGVRLQEAFSNARHQWMWDTRSLAFALREVGFCGVTARHYGEWADMRFAEVEERARHQDSICLEAQKPSEVDSEALN
jgi:SAM-dependent methyltransferase